MSDTTAATASPPPPDDAVRHVLALTARIVAAHLGRNPVAPERLPELIRGVHAALGDAAALGGGTAAAADPARRAPAVPVKRSVGREWIACLECGARMVMLKRHILTEHGLTPEAYRERWGLGLGYPLVAPAYAEMRSTVAKQIGLGARRAGRAGRGEPPPAEEAAPPTRAPARPAAEDEDLQAGDPKTGADPAVTASSDTGPTAPAARKEGARRRGSSAVNDAAPAPVEPAAPSTGSRGRRRGAARGEGAG